MIINHRPRAIAIAGVLLSLLAFMPAEAQETDPVGHVHEPCPGCIDGHVYLDVNGNGIFDDDETLIAGATVTIVGVGSATTVENGGYCVCPVAEGTYDITVVTLDGLTASVLQVEHNSCYSIIWIPVVPEVDCGNCAGGVTDLTFRYVGDEASFITVNQGKHDVLFSGLLYPGDEFSVSGTKRDFTFGKDISLIVDCQDKTKVHTSCSKPIGPGSVFGDFEVVSGVSLLEGFLCVPTIPETSLCDSGKPQALGFLYTPRDCTFSSHTQNPDKVECDDFEGELGNLVFIIAGDRADMTGKIWFADTVAVGETFFIDAALAGDSRLKAATHVQILDMADGAVLQQIEFHTSCSQPLSLGNVFGALELVDFILD